MERNAWALAALDGRAEIVLLTMMPHRHRATRRAHLDALGLPYPLLTTEMAKGPAIRRLRGDSGRDAPAQVFRYDLAVDDPCGHVSAAHEARRRGP